MLCSKVVLRVFFEFTIFLCYYSFVYLSWFSRDYAAELVCWLIHGPPSLFPTLISYRDNSNVHAIYSFYRCCLVQWHSARNAICHEKVEGNKVKE